jgi:geranylgeranyl pyrophosphate synthase
MEKEVPRGAARRKSVGPPARFFLDRSTGGVTLFSARKDIGVRASPLSRFDPMLSLSALFSRDFSDAALRALLGLQGGIPRAHLDRALFEPACEFLLRPGKCFRARLVEIGWSLVEEREPVPVELPLLVEVLHAASLIVDDIQDDSTHRRQGFALHRQLGTPIALNAGNWLYFWPFEIVTSLGLAPERELDVRQRMTRALYLGHFGQALDLGAPLSQLDREEIPQLVQAIAALKTGRLMQLAASIGPAAAGAPEKRIEALERFGLALGVGEDLRLGRPTWVWAWLAETLEPDDFRALQLRARRVEDGSEPPDGLARRLAGLLGSDEREAVHAHLENAFDALSAELGNAAKLTALRDEIARLESSYV